MKTTNYRRKKAPKHKTYKLMSCAPIVIGKRVIKNSCYTSNAIEKIKQGYNRQYPDKQITETDPETVWKILKERLTECKNQTEECWLETIQNTQLQKKIDEYIFAPDAPPVWTKNPNEWLSNIDIEKVLRQYEDAYPNFKFFSPTPIDFETRPHYYGGKCVSDELCNFSVSKLLENKKTKIGFIFNLDKHTQSGSHWVSMFLDLENKIIFYFDSTGEDIPEEIETFKNRIMKQATEQGIELKFIKNHPQSHQYGNTECGMYSLYFIVSMLTLPHKKSIYLFKGKKRIPDKLMEKYRRIYFNI